MDAEVGTTIPEFRVDGVSAEKMKTMALFLHDPVPIHWDVEAVKAQGLGDKVVNQGPNNMGYVLNALIAWTGDPAAVHAFTVRFLGNVFADDVLVASGVVTAVREDGGQRLADCEVWLDRDGGDRVMAGTATVRVS